MKLKNHSIIAVVKSRKAITILFAIIIIMFIASTAHNFAGTADEKAEYVYYVSQTMLAVFAMIGVVIAVWQFHLSYKQVLAADSLLKIQNAVNLSRYYKDEILSESTYVIDVYNESGISKILDDISFDNMKQFDQNEMQATTLSLQKVETIKKILDSDDFVRLIHKKEKEFFPESPLANLGQYDEDAQKFTFSDEEKKSLSHHFHHAHIARTLNSLEYFAMNFQHGIAEESVVYDSLHQTYAKYMRIFYYDISSSNTSKENKYFSNAIYLYNLWYNRLRENEKASKKVSDSSVHHPVS